MTRVFICTVLAIMVLRSNGQDITVRRLQSEVERSIKKDFEDTSKWVWKRGGLINANFSQGSLSNWAAGGDKFSMAINTYANYYIFYRQGKQNWDNNLDFNFGFIQSTSLGTRKNDDRLDLLSKYGYNLDGKFYISALLNFRTQFFNGYTYSGENREFSSSFLSPAYVVTSIGMDYKPTSNFSAFLSPVTSRYVIVTSRYLSDTGAYGVPKGSHSVGEFGAFATLNYNQIFPRQINYKGRLDLFSNYLRKAGNIDLFMTNYVAFKINKFFSANYNLDLIYDDDVRLFGKNGTSPGLQLKSLIGIGFLMRF